MQDCAGDGHFSRTPVTRRLQQPTRASNGPDQPARRKDADAHIWPCSGWGLPSQPGRPGCWCALTAPFHPYRDGPLTGAREQARGSLNGCRGGLLSVALSRALRPVGVIDHPYPVEPGLSSPRGAGLQPTVGWDKLAERAPAHQLIPASKKPTPTSSGRPARSETISTISQWPSIE